MWHRRSVLALTQCQPRVARVLEGARSAGEEGSRRGAALRRLRFGLPRGLRSTRERARIEQREDRDLGPNAIANAQAEADPLVHVQIAGADLIKARGKTAATRTESEPAQAGQHHLPPMRVTAQHQVAAMP